MAGFVSRNESSDRLLGELVGKERPQRKRFADDEIVSIAKDARFVSIRQSAPVA